MARPLRIEMELLLEKTKGRQREHLDIEQKTCGLVQCQDPTPFPTPFLPHRRNEMKVDKKIRKAFDSANLDEKLKAFCERALKEGKSLDLPQLEQMVDTLIDEFAELVLRKLSNEAQSDEEFEDMLNHIKLVRSYLKANKKRYLKKKSNTSLIKTRILNLLRKFKSTFQLHNISNDNATKSNREKNEK